MIDDRLREIGRVLDEQAVPTASGVSMLLWEEQRRRARIRRLVDPQLRLLDMVDYVAVWIGVQAIEEYIDRQVLEQLCIDAERALGECIPHKTLDFGAGEENENAANVRDV